MIDLQTSEDSFSGSLLLAHPNLQDPNFRQSVVLVSSHQSDQGAMGIVLNKPLGKTLGDLDEKLQGDPLGNTPIFHGGPVSNNEIILTGWKWSTSKVEFRLYFGITIEKARSLIEQEKDIQLKAYLGYSGWSSQQLEEEIGEKAWIRLSLQQLSPEYASEDNLWKKIMQKECPQFNPMGTLPDDLSHN